MLALRAQEPDLFARGEYLPLAIEGPCAQHAIAFARRHQDQLLIVIATHLPWRLAADSGMPSVPSSVWEETAVLLPDRPDMTCIAMLTGDEAAVISGRLQLSAALPMMPAAVLMQASQARKKHNKTNEATQKKLAAPYSVICSGIPR